MHRYVQPPKNEPEISSISRVLCHCTKEDERRILFVHMHANFFVMIRDLFNFLLFWIIIIHLHRHHHPHFFFLLLLLFFLCFIRAEESINKQKKVLRLVRVFIWFNCRLLVENRNPDIWSLIIISSWKVYHDYLII